MKNDWIVAAIYNPEFTNDDFKDILDMDTANTTLLGYQDYLKSDFIKQNPLFQDEKTGKFSEQKFKDFYVKRVQDFDEFQTNEFYQGPALDMFDIDRKPGTPIQDIQFSIQRGWNPDRQAIGIEGVNVWSDPTFSKREIAKQNKVFDYTTGEELDYTVNDHTLVTSALEWFKDLWKDPLVMATWDEDGTHLNPITGMTEQHQKGEYKLNDKGTYYYETLGNRSVIGKDVLSVFDTFTVDGQGLNKYDFFDSNDLEKSVAGTVMKNVAALVPLFLGPEVAAIYGGLTMLKEFGKAMPMLYGISTALLNDSDTPDWMNQWAAQGNKWTGSTSDYAQEHTFSFENFGNLIADVALQWQQQKFIAQAMTKFKTRPDYIAEATAKAEALYATKAAQLGESAELREACLKKFLPDAEKLATKSGALGRDLSLAYMAIVSNSDVYADALEAGTTKKEAAAIALGSTLGMFAVDKYLGLGEIFFDEATANPTKLARKALKDEFKEAQKVFDQIKTSKAPAQKKLLQYIQKGAETSKRVWSTFKEDLKYHSTNFLEKMFAEGMEEVNEELVTDISKSLYELAGSFGFDTSVKKIGAWENMFERYTMSFLGGAIGGGIFYGKEVWDTKQFHRPNADKDIATLIRNGYADDVRAQIAKMYEEGYTGNKNLSASEYEFDEKGKPVFKTTDNVQDSQAKAVANMVLDKVNSIETILYNNQVGLSDDQLFDNMVLSEQRYNRYKEIAPITSYYDDFSTVLNELLKAETSYRVAQNTVDGTVDGKQKMNDRALPPELETVRQKNLSQLQAQVVEARTKVSDFLAGETSLDYVRKLNFAMDPVLHEGFLPVTQDEYFQQKHPGVSNIQSLPVEAQMQFVQDWYEYVQTQLKTNLSVSYAKFKEFEEQVRPHLATIAAEAPTYKQWVESMNEVLKNGGLHEDILQKSKNWDEKLDDESDEEYKSREKKKVDQTTGVEETDAEFNTRIRERRKKLDAHNDKIAQEWVDTIDVEFQKIGYKVDPLFARQIKARLLGPWVDEKGEQITSTNRLAAVLERKLKLVPKFNITPADRNKNLHHIEDIRLRKAVSLEIQNYLSQIKTDLSNVDEVKAAIETAITRKLYNLSLSFYGQQRIPDTLKLRTPVYKVVTTTQNADGSTKPETKYYRADPQLKGPNITTTQVIECSLEEYLAIAESLQYNDNVQNEYGEPVEVRDFALQDVAGGETDYVLDNLSDESRQAFKDTYDAIVAPGMDASEVTLYDLLPNKKLPLKRVGSTVQGAIDTVMNDISTAVSDYKNSPLVKFQQKLDESIVNPITVLIQKMAAAQGETVADIEKILSIVQNDFDTLNDISELQLDNVQREQLLKAQKYLDLAQRYLYAAGTTPEPGAPIGHNKMINEFAANNKDKLRGTWNPLPEIDSDYTTMYMTSLAHYKEQIEQWISFSDYNQMNQLRNYAETERRFSSLIWERLQNSNLRKFTFNGKPYDLLAGTDALDVELLRGDQAQKFLYNAERILYKNLIKAAQENGYKVTDTGTNPKDLVQFIIDGKLLEGIFGVDGLKAFDTVKETRLYPGMTAADIQNFAYLQYIGTLISQDPAEFYERLAARVKADDKVAPLAIQEFNSRLAQASATPQFRRLMEYVYSQQTDKSTPFLSNTTRLFGTAGAGKTEVILKSIDAPIKDKKVWIIGPTSDQATHMKQAMGRVEGDMNFDQLMRAIVGDTLWTSIKTAIDQAKIDQTTWVYSGEYFDLSTGSDGLVKVNMHWDKITLSTLADGDKPAAIYIDEATHLNTVQALIVDRFAKSLGIQVFMLGDPLQRGAKNKNSGIANIDSGAVWGTIAPPLTLSLRPANLQQFQNQNKVRTLLDELNTRRFNTTRADFDAYFDTAKNLTKRLKLGVYDGAEIQGDMFTKSLSPELLAKLKAAQEQGKTIGFIGDSTSPYITQLEAAGIKLPKDGEGKKVFTIEQMQGQEFDYTVVDYRFTKENEVKDTLRLYSFLTDLYTLMTRARSGTIFIDNGLTDIVGDNVISDHPAKAPSLAAGIPGLRQKKSALLESLDFTRIEPTSPQQPAQNPPAPAPQGQPTPQPAPAPQPTPTPAPAPQPAPQPAPAPAPAPAPVQNSGQVNPDQVDMTNPNFREDFNEPDSRPQTEVEREVISEATITDDSSAASEVPDSESNVSAEGFVVECYGDARYLGVSQDEEESEYTTSEGRVIRTHAWHVTRPTSGPLRDAQIVYGFDSSNSIAVDGGKQSTIYSHKRKWDLQVRLSKALSALLFDKTDWQYNTEMEVPDWMRKIFGNNGEHLFDTYGNLKGKFVIQFRTPGELDTRGIGNRFRNGPRGIEYAPGQFVIANLTFQTTLPIDGAMRECIFDLGGLNNPETLIQGQETAKSNIQKAIANLETRRGNKAKTHEQTKLEKLLEDWDNGRDLYVGWFNQQIAEYVKLQQSEGPTAIHAIELDPEEVILHKATILRSREEPIRLGGQVNPDIIDATDYYDLIDQNPDKIFSPVYTFSGEEHDLLKIDPTLKGKAVIFVGTNTLMKKDRLITQYIRQKMHPDGNAPTVRMIVLDNYGVSFSQLLDTEFSASQTADGEWEGTPIRKNWLGLRMFTSMWNFRANLLNFREQVEEFKRDHNLTEAQLNILLRQQYAWYEYKQNNPSDSTQELPDQIFNTLQGCFSSTATKEQALKLLTDLDEFNNKTCDEKNIHMFRLGYSTREDHGFHIQRFATPTSFRDRTEANMVVITPEKAEQFYKMINDLLSFIHPGANHFDPESTLNLSLQEVITDPTTGVTREEIWAPNRLIDFDDSQHQNSLSNMVQPLEQGDGFQIVHPDDIGKVLAFPRGAAWSGIPTLLTKAVRKLVAIQKDPSLVHNGETRKDIKVRYYTGEHQLNERVYDLRGFIGTETDSGYLNMKEGQPFDASLLHMLNLMFHGTIEDIHGYVKTYNDQHEVTAVTKRSEPLMQADDAYFRNGFYINPEATFIRDSTGQLVGKGNMNSAGKVRFYEVKTPLWYFTSNVDVLGIGVQLSLNLFKPNRPAPTRTTTTTSEGSNTTVTDVADWAGEELGYEWDYEVEGDVVQANLQRYNEQKERAIKNALKTDSEEDLLNRIYKLNSFSTEGIVRFGEYLEQTYNPLKDGELQLTLVTKDSTTYLQISKRVGNTETVLATFDADGFHNAANVTAVVEEAGTSTPAHSTTWISGEYERYNNAVQSFKEQLMTLSQADNSTLDATLRLECEELAAALESGIQERLKLANQDQNTDYINQVQEDIGRILEDYESLLGELTARGLNDQLDQLLQIC